MIRIDAEKLRDISQRRGFSKFEAIAERAKEMGLDLGLATIYNLAANKNWTRDKLQALCQVLECDPRDFIYFERESPKAIAPIRPNGITVNTPA